jgi:hypothetical protein
MISRFANRGKGNPRDHSHPTIPGGRGSVRAGPLGVGCLSTERLGRPIVWHHDFALCEPWQGEPTRSFTSNRSGRARLRPSRSAGRALFENRTNGPISRLHRDVPCFRTMARGWGRISIPASVRPLHTVFARCLHIGTAHTEVRPPAHPAHIDHDLNTFGSPELRHFVPVHFYFGPDSRNGYMIPI